INASETVISTGAPSEAFGALQYGKDGKIYVARVLGTSIGVINDPDIAGAACNYVHSGVSLSGRTCRGGLPNNIAHNLPVCNVSSSMPSFTASDTNVCEKFCTNFTDQSNNNPTSWQWQFPGGTPASSTDQNPI